MNYVSTRGRAPAVSFADAVLAGLAPDGGLYVPETWPQTLNDASFKRRAAADLFHRIALNVLNAFSGESVSGDDADALTADAYKESHWPLEATPLQQIGPGQWLLVLFHGPSLAFKDVAMQLIGSLYDHILSARDQRLSVVCATSGDTGGAAVEALKGRERVDLFVLLPKGRVSDVQRRFMTTSAAQNVFAIEIDGDFDACQAIVKTLFADRDFSARARLSGVNSINWARILAQSVYFHIAANTLCAPGPVHFVVPTGNFGDAYAGYVAKRMGAPIGTITLAVNANDILERALRTGRYERAAASHATLSPAMDIQVASNFERILFEALDRDGEHVARLYDRFAQSGGFDIPPDALAFLRDHFAAQSVTDAETMATMRAHTEVGRLVCPHTAVALHARTGDAPAVYLATAHPAKFPDTVEAATGQRPALPAKCADLFSRTETMHALGADAEAVKAFIRSRSRAWA
ncbi:MAG: threonine synthase [Hyphomonadaceae bacterium]|nr:threonine synthase [Hyphomonadaceae bacterium]